jgi:hypothetical protein
MDKNFRDVKTNLGAGEISITRVWNGEEVKSLIASNRSKRVIYHIFI